MHICSPNTIKLLIEDTVICVDTDKEKINKIEYNQKSGDVMINTTRGPRRAMSFKLLEGEFACPADKYR